MNYRAIDVRRDGAAAWLTLNRPERLNALNPQMVDELRDYFTGLAHDTETRVVVIRGAGRAFCAGLDLKEPGTGDGSPSSGMRGQRRISDLALMMHRAPQPFIACVHGPASGGGFALALAADVRLAGQSARMNAAFIRIGVSACDVGVSYFLPRAVGASVASELMLTGRFIHADRALATGLVSAVVPDDQLEKEAAQLVDEMLATTPLALRLTKECLAASVDASSLDHAIAMEDRNQVLCTQTSDFREGISAFLAKRTPNYTDS